LCAAEVVGTFIAMYVILESVCNPRTKAGNVAPIAIGSAFGLLLTVLSPFSSGSFNPARSLGPAAVSGQSDDLWIWIFGPIVGALLAVPFHLVSVAEMPAALKDQPAADEAKPASPHKTHHV
jgi:glycerol uptake facilitator-like aquaporin